MSVKKFRDVSEMDEPIYEVGSQRLYEVIRHVWGLSDLICPLKFPSGIFKHRSIEDAERLRERWEDANFAAHQARVRPATVQPSSARSDVASEPGAAASRRFWEAAAFAERFFTGQDEVHAAMRRLCATLEADGIPYAIAGAMALNAHGYRRVTLDIDVLLTAEGLAAFKARQLGHGWVERSPGSRGMRDTVHDVKIDVLITGDFPGDGKPKSVRFPSPDVAIPGDGVMILPVDRLVELKLASGMTDPDRLKDLADVQELIRAARLPLALGTQIDPMVQEKYAEIWNATRLDRDDEY